MMIYYTFCLFFALAPSLDGANSDIEDPASIANPSSLRVHFLPFTGPELTPLSEISALPGSTPECSDHLRRRYLEASARAIVRFADADRRKACDRILFGPFCPSRVALVRWVRKVAEGITERTCIKPDSRPLGQVMGEVMGEHRFHPQIENDLLHCELRGWNSCVEAVDRTNDIELAESILAFPDLDAGARSEINEILDIIYGRASIWTYFWYRGGDVIRENMWALAAALLAPEALLATVVTRTSAGFALKGVSSVSQRAAMQRAMSRSLSVPFRYTMINAGTTFAIRGEVPSPSDLFGTILVGSVYNFAKGKLIRARSMQQVTPSWRRQDFLLDLTLPGPILFTVDTLRGCENPIQGALQKLSVGATRSQMVTGMLRSIHRFGFGPKRISPFTNFSGKCDRAPDHGIPLLPLKFRWVLEIHGSGLGEDAREAGGDLLLDGAELIAGALEEVDGPSRARR